MKKKDEKHRVYSKKFKAEAIALACKREKLISLLLRILGINENILYQWMKQAQEAAGSSLPAFPSHRRASG